MRTFLAIFSVPTQNTWYAFSLDNSLTVMYGDCGLSSLHIYLGPSDKIVMPTLNTNSPQSLALPSTSRTIYVGCNSFSVLDLNFVLNAFSICLFNVYEDILSLCPIWILLDYLLALSSFELSRLYKAHLRQDCPFIWLAKYLPNS